VDKYIFALVQAEATMNDGENSPSAGVNAPAITGVVLQAIAPPMQMREMMATPECRTKFYQDYSDSARSYSIADVQAGSTIEPVALNFFCGMRNLKAALLANTFKRNEGEGVPTVENLTEALKSWLNHVLLEREASLHDIAKARADVKWSFECTFAFATEHGLRQVYLQRD
jgi:hypothetical protein